MRGVEVTTSAPCFNFLFMINNETRRSAMLMRPSSVPPKGRIIARLEAPNKEARKAVISEPQEIQLALMIALRILPLPSADTTERAVAL